MPKVKTMILEGTETEVKFEKGYPYYIITNMGDGELYASGSPGITAYADGVYTILPGTETRISPEKSADTVYLLGSGTVQVRAEEIAVPVSFKPAGKGGEFQTVDNILSTTSTNPVQNKVIAEALNGKLNTSDIPDWALSPDKPVYTADEVGADESGSANTALSAANAYTDTAIANLVGTAPETLDTLEELAAAIQNDQTVIEALDNSITNKVDKSSVKSAMPASPADTELLGAKLISALLNGKQDTLVDSTRITDKTIDWNTFTATGVKVISIANMLDNSATHGLDGVYGYGVLAVFNMNSIYYQIYISDMHGIYFRTCYSENWRSWARIDSLNKADKSEVEIQLDTKLDKAIPPLVHIIGKTMGEFKTWFTDWWRQNYSTYCTIRVNSDLSQIINNWDNDDYIFISGPITQITPIVSYDTRSDYAKFMMASYDNAKTAQMTLRDNIPEKPVYLVHGIKGEAETDYRTGNVNITQENLGIVKDLGSIAGLTISQFKNKVMDALSSMTSPVKTLTVVANGVIGDLVSNWDNGTFIIPADDLRSGRFQITVIGGRSTVTPLYTTFILSSYISLDAPYFCKVERGVFSPLQKLAFDNGYTITDSTTFDFDTFTKTGNYNLNFTTAISTSDRDAAHAPSDFGNYGLLEVTNISGGLLWQRLTSHLNSVYLRHKGNNGWSQWDKIATPIT